MPFSYTLSAFNGCLEISLMVVRNRDKRYIVPVYGSDESVISQDHSQGFTVYNGKEKECL